MITHQQRKAMLYIEAEIDRSGSSPTLRDIARHLKHRSISTAHWLVSGLEQRGFIRREKYGARALVVVRPVSRFAAFKFDDETKRLRLSACPQKETAQR